MIMAVASRRFENSGLRRARLVAALALVALPGLLCPSLAHAAEGMDGSRLSLLWGLPFAGVLLSIALGPLLAPGFWHHHYGKVALGWGLLTLIPLIASYGFKAAFEIVFHALMLEYVPFIILLLALFTAAGGIAVRGNIHGSPAVNTGILAIGTVSASVIGTTGAAMIFVRPLIRANDDRKHNVHVIVFFIFLVANIGGALTPLGDPPLFLGFLRGVDFFWPLQHLWQETLLASGILLAVFFVLDSWLERREGRTRPDPTPDNPVSVIGLSNLALIGVVIAAVIMSANWDAGSFTAFGTTLKIQNLVRDAILIGVTFLSIAITPAEARERNGFNWEPIAEVAKLFAAIFLCIVPVLAMLGAGGQGPFANLLSVVSRPDGSFNNDAFFWLTGALSSFLDNAPTYLVFFELAGGDPKALSGPLYRTLEAISLGAVFMGANTYIGNAPNFMVYAIARSSGVNMPTFFGYMLWSTCLLLPLFLLISWLLIW